MPFQFDPQKDAENLRKHGVSLARAEDLLDAVVFDDVREDYGEQRFRAFGLIGGEPHMLAFTYRGADVRPISLRRASWKELERAGWPP